MEVNNFEIWKISDLNNYDIDNLSLDSVTYDSNLQISLSSSNYNIYITFNRFVSYRINNESYLLEYWHKLDASKLNGYTFYKIKSSTYFNDLAFLSNNFCTDGGPEMINHFAIFTVNECIEIITDMEPFIEIIEL